MASCAALLSVVGESGAGLAPLRVRQKAVRRACVGGSGRTPWASWAPGGLRRPAGVDKKLRTGLSGRQGRRTTRWPSAFFRLCAR